MRSPLSMTIVCATHFTESSGDALAVAVALARKTGQPLWLASVTRGFSFNPSFGPPQAERATDTTLHVEANALRKEGLTVEVAVVHGRFDRAVRRLCEDVGAGLVVLGDTRHSAPSFSSTPADRLATSVNAPVLMVRDRRPFEAWATGGGPLQVLFALDHTWRAEVARSWLKHLAGYGALDLLAVHVWTRDDERAKKHSTPDDLEVLLKAETAAVLSDLPPNCVARAELAYAPGDVAQVLSRLADEAGIKLIAMGTHGPKGLFGRMRSVSHEVLVTSHASVVLVPDREHPERPLDRMTPSSPRTVQRMFREQ
jgi:nucleotide-binding universal stress UspA family protein